MAKVLVVDDDPDLANVLDCVLRARGHEVWVAHDGLEALNSIALARPDVVICDVEMPVLSGPDAVYVMRLRDNGDEKIPVVLVSGIVNLAAVAGATGTPYYLAKPYELEDVVRILERAIKERLAPSPRRRP